MIELNSESGAQETELLTPPKKTRRRAIILGLVILVSGFMLGAGFTTVFLHHMLHHIIHNPGEAPKRITKRMKCKLDLSDEQAAKMQAILTERQKALLAIFCEIRPRIEYQIKRTRDEVAAILDQEQAKQWFKQFDHMRRKWRHIVGPEVSKPE
jgi:hypothetical protein